MTLYAAFPAAKENETNRRRGATAEEAKETRK
jgi:hypothetical protein